MTSVRLSATAALIVCGSLLVLAVTCIAVDRLDFLPIYKNRFSFKPGPRFAEALAKAAETKDACLIVGASTAREGIDQDILSRSAVGKTFNGATTGGNIEVLEIQAQIIARYGTRFRCIIAGVHPWLMFDNDPPLLNSTGYLAHLRISDVFSLSDLSPLLQEKKETALSFLVPLRKQAQDLNKNLRMWIYKFQMKMRQTPLGLPSYETFADELVPAGDLLYPPGIDLLKDGTDTVAARFRDEYSKYRFHNDITIKSFRRALNLFEKHASELFIVMLPVTSLMEHLDEEGLRSFNLALSDSHAKIIDCRKLFSDSSYFLDEAHLKPSGREILTRSLVNALTHSATTPRYGGEHCWGMSNNKDPLLAPSR